MHDQSAQTITDDQAPPRISVPGDAVTAALARLEAAGDINAQAQEAIWWFYCHARDAGMSLADAGRCIHRDATTVHRMLNGRYGARYDNLVDEIVRYRQVAEERARRRDIGYVETSTWRKISAVCRSALYDRLPAFIYGASQIGKTCALLEYQRRNAPGTRYVRMPAAPSMTLALHAIAEACYIPVHHTQADMRRRIIGAFNDRTLLLVDEFHQAMANVPDLTARKIVEFVREIYDRTGCGIVICGTKVLREELERGRQYLAWEQFRRRGIISLQLPDIPPKADVVKIASGFGLPEPDAATMEAIRELLRANGVGKFFRLLQYASALAGAGGRALDWEDYRTAYRSVTALAQ